MSEHIDEIEDGGPAFPKPGTDECIDVCGSQRGMSLRDWFAGQALAGMLTNNRAAILAAKEDIEKRGDLKGGDRLPLLNFIHHCPTVSISAYQFADAMLAARKQVRG